MDEMILPRNPKMSDVLEPAVSSRSRCRHCRKEIEEGDLRFGSDYEGLYGDGAASYVWFHVRCASQRMPDRLLPLLRKATRSARESLDDFDKILAACDKNLKKSTSKFPYGERAASGRAKCIKCDQAIAKGELRVAVEREIQTGSFTQVGAGYLHPACAVAHLEDPELGARLKSASPLLDKKDCEEIATLCDAAAKSAPAPKKKEKEKEKPGATTKRTGSGDELVFADQLIEKGDPRGELIVVASELDEIGIDSAKGAKLHARALELLPKATAAWSKELGIAKTGFVLEMGLPSRVPVPLGAKKLGKVTEHKWIIGYRARNGGELALSELLRHPSFARIRSLVVEGVVQFTWEGLKGFFSCDEVKNLEWLEISFSFGPRALLMAFGSTKLERLTRLTIGCGFTLEPDLRGFDRVAGLPSLKTLHFRPAVYAEVAELFLRSPLAQRLEEIGIPSYFAPNAVESLKLPNLRRLILSGGFLHAKTLKALQEADFPRLGFLDISGANVTSAAATDLANKKVLPKLRRLDVSRNPIDAATLDALRGRFGDQLICENMIEPPRKRKAKVTARKKK
jgi:hypothetical protein